jgi:hypothetical protein
MGPDRLDQLDEELPVGPFSLIPLPLGVFLLHYASEPCLDMLGAHPQGPACTAIREASCDNPDLAIRWNVVVDFRWSEM